MAPSNVLFVCIDTLRRDVLGAYDDGYFGYEVRTPNLDRFANRATTFDSHYAGSLPTMPARREYLTGVQQFLWRHWDGIEPFDTTLPALSVDAGIPAHLVTDNYHCFQARSVHGFYEDYSSFELVRGHESDAWRSSPKEPDPVFLEQVGSENPHDPSDRPAQYARNVADFEGEEDFFAPRVFSRVSDWLAANREWERWLLVADSFDVHEPFHVPEPYQSMYTDLDPDDPALPKWHQNGWLEEDYWTDRRLEFVRAQYAGKVTMLDRWLGRVFDRLDELGLWGETMVVVTSDHGVGLGDHGYVGKNFPPVHDELAHLPLLVWDPESDRMGERVEALTSAVDIHATLLDALDLDGDSVHGRSLLPLLRDGRERHREVALYGWHYGSVNVTDGRYTYLHPTDPDGPLYEYTALPPEPDALPEDAELAPHLPYTEYPVWKIPREPSVQNVEPLLYDSRTDPDQETDLVGEDPAAVARMQDRLVGALEAMGAPDEQYQRLGLAGRL